MTSQESELIRSALALLHRLVPPGEPHASDATPRRCPVNLFVKKYLVRDPASDLTTVELWRFFSEISTSGELEPRPKAEFLRCLPGAMQSVFGAHKCHSIERNGRRLRGFRGVNIRLDGSPPAVLEPEAE